ncbi:DUF1761 domain-containing protein [Candidatus Gracilibacteria bacterium]|nr:DUF1761 domain-containing protein [Candidatus Gracilibacteria bacterium]MCF7898735.1 DUF1761 domain-containing protein [Candidatus Paceibacterota bacterium]
MQFFTPTTILIATILGFGFGALWYSPALFMRAWLMGEGIEKSELPKRSKMYMIQINVYSFLAHGAMASVVALMLELLQVSSLKVALVLGGLLTLGFMVTTNFINMVYTTEGVHYSRKHQIKFLVNSGYYICVISIMSATVFLLGYS